MTTVVRVKRHRSEDPASALVVACKRLKFAQSDGGEGGDGDHNSIPAVVEEKSLFNFAGTVESKSEPIAQVVKKALTQSAVSNRNPKSRIIDIHGKLRSEYKRISEKNRLKLTNTHRGIDLEEGSAVSESNPSEVELLYNLFDVIDENVETIAEEKKQVAKNEEITCNGVPLIRHNVPKEDSPTDADYVYDLYLTNGVDFDDYVLQQSVRIEKYSLDPTARFPDDDDEEDCDDDEDSNDENYYKNDYPEEDSDFEKDIDYWCDHDHESMVEHFSHCNIDDVADESFLGDEHPSEEDIWTLGPAYAHYKAKTLNEL